MTVPFAAEAESPPMWRCPHHGVDATLADAQPDPGQELPEQSAKTGKPPRTPLVMLRERRTTEELSALVEERLAQLRARRRGQH